MHGTYHNKYHPINKCTESKTDTQRLQWQWLAGNPFVIVRQDNDPESMFQHVSPQSMVRFSLLATKSTQS